MNLAAQVSPEVRLRKLLSNMIYVGVIAQLLGIDPAEMEKAILKQFASKLKAAEININAAQAGMRVCQGQPAQDRSVSDRADG